MSKSETCRRCEKKAGRDGLCRAHRRDVERRMAQTLRLEGRGY